MTGRGRGRGFLRPLENPANSPPSSISSNSSISPTEWSSINDSKTDSAISCTSSPISTPVSHRKAYGRGRAFRLNNNVIPNDPYWIVSNLTHQQFFTRERLYKPDELGTVGEVVTLLANYFQIFKFPHRGLVYKYQIQIKDRKDREIHRDRRRYLTFFNNFSSSLHIFDLFQCTIQCLVRDVL